MGDIKSRRKERLKALIEMRELMIQMACEDTDHVINIIDELIDNAGSDVKPDRIMNKITDISTHKDYQPIYKGVACRVRDKQKLMNKSILDLVDSMDLNKSGADFKTDRREDK